MFKPRLPENGLEEIPDTMCLARCHHIVVRAGRCMIMCIASTYSGAYPQSLFASRSPSSILFRLPTISATWVAILWVTNSVPRRGIRG